jgi:LPPG:FO 2-phospho-L-lactate transferase
VYVVLAGGIGAARFLRGLVRIVDQRDLTVIGNVGDDIELHGLHVSPDLDTITYTLGGGIDTEQEWGRAQETFTVTDELRRYRDESWFTLGDRDLATHIHRTARLRDGVPLSHVTAEITTAWGIGLRLLPATDDPVRTTVITRDGRSLHFQEYWVREHAAPDVEQVVLAGAEHALPAAGVLDAIAAARAVLICPSNPVVSIGTILAVPGIREAILGSHAPVVGVSPIVGGGVVRGMADRLLPAVGAEVSATGVARHYGPLLDGWVIDRVDADHGATIAELGLDVAIADTMLDDVPNAAAVAAVALEVAATIRGRR